MRLGRLIGDLIANLRSNIRYTLQDMGLSLVRPNSGKWTVHTSRGRTIVDYVSADQRARRLIVEFRVWEGDYIPGSDHGLVFVSLNHGLQAHLPRALMLEIRDSRRPL